MIPIIVNVTDRVQYLPYMFNSLLISNIQNTKIHICSNQKYEMFIKEINYNKSITKEINLPQKINLPDINYKIKSLKTYAKIDIINQNIKHIQKLKYILNYYFNLYKDQDFIIILKDDIVFNKNWLTNLLEIYDKTKQNLGFIAGCDLNWNVYFKNYKESEQNLQKSYINVYEKPKRYASSQCYLITKQFYNKWKTSQLDKTYTYNSDINEASDLIINRAALALNFNIYLPTPQYIEHIGMKSQHRKLMYTTHLFQQPICYQDILKA